LESNADELMDEFADEAVPQSPNSTQTTFPSFELPTSGFSPSLN
jgi:hypothetical protein